MAEIEMYGYVADEMSPKCQVPTGSHDFRARIRGFELSHVEGGLYVLSFVTKYDENGKMVVRAAALRMTEKEVYELRKTLTDLIINGMAD